MMSQEREGHASEKSGGRWVFRALSAIILASLSARATLSLDSLI